MNSLRQLGELGQSVWLDYIRRDLITSGRLKHLVEEDGLSGLTSNPTIFGKAISGDSEYDAAIRHIVQSSPEVDSPTLFEKIEVEDLQMAADILRPVYDRTNKNDGFVSIEVSPKLAYDTKRSIAEARRLWSEVDRPNLMVKIPATTEGIPVVEALIAEGINVNITLMFSLSQYEDVAEAYLNGIRRNQNPEKITSVASFFVSRVDTAVDKALEEIGTQEALAVRGQAGIANAHLAYKRFRDIFFSPEFERLKQRGVRIQKPLWASTGTKNKNYSDVLYIEGLIAPDTVNSIPRETLDAFRDHGKPRIALTEDTKQAEDVVGKIESLGINMHSVGQELTEEGVEKFVKSYDELIAGLDQKRASLERSHAA